MKEIVVLSGKGGTGKTTIVGSFATLIKNKVMVDCDVDAADLHLLLSPTIKKETEFWSGELASIDEAKCTQCGLCQDVCRFDAITDFIVDPVSCEGCGFCYNVCPEDAVIMKENLCGHWFISQTRYGPLVHARLGIAQENSGKLVAVVRQEAKRIAKEKKLDYIISDGPPGIGCPVISSLSGADLAVIITEPTLSGIHDLERIIGLCHHFNIPAMVCVNKYDINQEATHQIETYCLGQGIPVASQIPYDDIVTEALVNGLPVVEYSSNGVSRQIKSLWQDIAGALERGKGAG